MRGQGTGAWLVACLLAWLGGVAMQLHERELSALSVYVSVATIGIVAIAVGIFWRRRRVAPVVAVLAVAALGFACTGLQATLRLAETLPHELEGRDLVVTGVVASLPQQGPGGLRFRFDLDPAPADDPLARVPRTLALGWYAGYHEDAAVVQPRSELRAGQRWRFSVRLRQPHGNLNPGGFDYELMLLEQGVRATGYVRDAPAAMLDASAGHPVERARQRVRDAIYAHVTDRRAAGVLAALAVGDQSSIERDDWDLFRNAGVAHLMAISGVHVTMFAWLAGLLVAAVWRRSARATLWLATPIAARWGGLAAATAYALFSGWGVPSQRTIWMLATVTVLRVAGVRWPWLAVLLVAAVVVTALDPWALTQAGFWLSFMAVGLLMASSYATGAAQEVNAVASPGWPGWPRRVGAGLRDGVRAQAIATLGLTPLTLVFFQQVSLVGFLANLVAIPLVTLVITPLALVGIAVSPLWNVGASIVAGLVALLTRLTAVPGAVWTLPVAPLWAQLAGLLAAALVVMPVPWRAKAPAVPLALALLIPPLDPPVAGSFDLVAADIGQGTAVIVRTREHVLLFDSGPQYSRETDAGQRVLVPLLRARGEQHVDLMVLSHRDSDHVGGARSVLGALRVDALSSSLEEGHPLLEVARRAYRCEAGQRWNWDGVDFAVLHPLPGDYERKLRSNAMSCVLRVSGGGRSVLLTGDIEREQEAALVESLGEAVRSDALVVPHHGSKTSSSAPFLDAVRPSIAVFQAGYRNRFGHPAAEVLERYRARGIRIVASPACGAWQWRADGPPEGTCERVAMRRYWQHRVDREGP
ncbi:MAG: DNA internalization-related competence protein ComEC/Rec2 [Caldimonas sp.]